MISSITLHHVLPDVFRGRTLCSEVWQQELTFQRDQTYLVAAQSGTGKSSLCSFIDGYRTDYEGSILLDERDIRSFSSRELSLLWQDELGLLFQELRLFTSLTAEENVWIKNQQTHFRDAAWIRAMFERLGVADKQHERVSTLSWGQQQRVAMIRLLCQPASFLMLDEPISHLDEQNAQTMADVLMEEKQQRGLGIIVTSIGKHLPIPYDVRYRL